MSITQPHARRPDGVLHRTAGLLAGRDVAVVYALVVAALAVSISLLPGHRAEQVVLNSSTNLDNLRSHPPFVLLVSAFVVPSLWHLWVLVPLVWAYGTLQRWLGRAATVVTAALGHVGATLFVATILTAGIAHGRISLSVGHAADVGVSYGLASCAGLVTAHLPRRRAWVYATVVSAVLGGLLLEDRGFTDLGHLTAWAIGLGLALVVDRARRSDRRTRPEGIPATQGRPG